MNSLNPRKENRIKLHIKVSTSSYGVVIYEPKAILSRDNTKANDIYENFFKQNPDNKNFEFHSSLGPCGLAKEFEKKLRLKLVNSESGYIAVFDTDEEKRKSLLRYLSRKKRELKPK